MNVYKIEAAGGFTVPVLATDPISPPDGLMWYNSTSQTFKKQENGATSNVAENKVFTTAILTDGQASGVLITYPVSFRAAVLKYYIERDGDVQVGYVNVATNGTTVSLTDENTYTTPVGIAFSADILSGDVRLLYTASLTGFNASIKYSLAQW